MDVGSYGSQETTGGGATTISPGKESLRWVAKKRRGRKNTVLSNIFVELQQKMMSTFGWLFSSLISLIFIISNANGQSYIDPMGTLRLDIGQYQQASNFWGKSLNEIKEVLNAMSLYLGMEIPKWPPENIAELSKKLEDIT